MASSYSSTESSSSPSSSSNAARRLETLVSHVLLNPSSSSSSVNTSSSSSSGIGNPAESKNKSNNTHTPKHVELNLNWNGWGFQGNEFQLQPLGEVSFVGDSKRYMYANQIMPNLREWMEINMGVDVNITTPSQSPKKCMPNTARIIFDGYLQELQQLSKHNPITVELDDISRIYHSHGHSAQEIYNLRFGQLERIVDCVVYPTSEDDCQLIIDLAIKYHDKVCLIPFGGGTNVSHALRLEANERRMIIAIDMFRMNKLLWIDKENNLACFQTGIIGTEVDKVLKPHGFILGHEPDSIEMSTLGGWIATKASGMKKNVYGNIEDMLVNSSLINGKGQLITYKVNVPRQSTGPDIQTNIIGSEGQFGLVTRAVLRIRKIPPVTRFGSILFPNFDLGFQALRRIQDHQIKPSSIRLVDNTQFHFGQAMKGINNSIWLKAIDSIKKWYILNQKKFHEQEMCAAILVFEGNLEQVNQQESSIIKVATQYGGIVAGEENGKRGYFLTYTIAYLRDYGIQYSFLGESFETTVPWSRALNLIESVKKVIYSAEIRYKLKKKPWVSARITQLYDTGVCIYFYLAFVWLGLSDPIKTFSNIEHEARQEILRQGGSLSHHHGVGKLRKEFTTEIIGNNGINVWKALKNEYDPMNIFATENFIPH